jgi:hypothetical protein
VHIIRYDLSIYSIGIEMRLRPVILTLSVLFLTIANVVPHAQACVGEAVIVQKEVLRVSTQASSQINVGDGMLRDDRCEPASTAPRGSSWPAAPISRSAPTPRSRSIAPCSTTSTLVATPRSG